MSDQGPDTGPVRRVPIPMAQMRILANANAAVNAAQQQLNAVLLTVCAGLGVDVKSVTGLDDTSDPPALVVAAEEKSA